MERSGVTGKRSAPLPASRRDASVVDAMSCTTESSLRDSFLFIIAYPHTPLRSMWGYNTVRPAGLRVGDDRCLFLNSTALISLNKEIFIYLISSILISRRVRILLFLPFSPRPDQLREIGLFFTDINSL